MAPHRLCPNGRPQLRPFGVKTQRCQTVMILVQKGISCTKLSGPGRTARTIGKSLSY